MMRKASLLGLATSLALTGPVLAESPAEGPATAGPEGQPERPSAIHDGREYLVPELAEDPLKVDEGNRRFQNRLSFSPAYGKLGDGKLYAMRFAYNPNSWLGYEVSLGHNPGDSVHALLHTLNGVVRYPIPWRAQPYGTLGFGMIMVFPGEALSTDPVTKNVFTAGGGLEFYIRNDIALRVEGRNVTVFGGDPQSEGTVAYRYGEATVALSFYRGLGK